MVVLEKGIGSDGDSPILTNNEMKWTSEDGEVHIIKRIHGGKNQGGFRNMEFIIEENEDDLHENGDKIMIRKKMIDMKKRELKKKN